MDLPSAAVQDAQQLARIAPMAMIFVPSRGGISHSPKEQTSWEEVANGAEVLYRTLLFLDERLNRDGISLIRGNEGGAKSPHAAERPFRLFELALLLE
jgi:hypothetical protein